jgi:Asp-tRNAAsn/Glu-tRNAGln amidotransferase A subunit and related amidases
LKPTWGVVSPKGQALPDTHADADISVVGPLARGAADLDLALDVMAGPDEIDGVAWKLDLPACGASSLADLRIAVKLRDPNCDVDAEYADKLQALVDAVAKRGATVKEIEPYRPPTRGLRALVTRGDFGADQRGGCQALGPDAQRNRRRQGALS